MVSLSERIELEHHTLFVAYNYWPGSMGDYFNAPEPHELDIEEILLEVNGNARDITKYCHKKGIIKHVLDNLTY